MGLPNSPHATYVYMLQCVSILIFGEKFTHYKMMNSIYIFLTMLLGTKHRNKRMLSHGFKRKGRNLCKTVILHFSLKGIVFPLWTRILYEVKRLILVVHWFPLEILRVSGLTELLRYCTESLLKHHSLVFCLSHLAHPFMLTSSFFLDERIQSAYP